ncbi:galactose mutarotase [Marinilabiliaceae bacterium JC017]|nr:galactose mutarotase [Marinilabiliaceae bacterium JC017]
MNFIKLLLFVLTMGLMNLSCNREKAPYQLIPESNFDTIIDGKQVKLFTLVNDHNLVAQITNLGGRVVSLWVPDRNGTFSDIVLGFDSPEAYLQANEKYFGATIGRYGNRIANGHFILDDKEYTLARNNGPNHLHGGKKGFCDVVWSVMEHSDNTLTLSYKSEDMEEGYPGNLMVKVRFELTNNDELKIEYWAKTDKATPVNLTHHSFFNLLGAGKGSINNHELMINAYHYTPVDETLIPSGEIASVSQTPMDFTQSTAIGSRIDHDFTQLKYGKGYDHNWVLNPDSTKLNFAARVNEKSTGRILEVYTNEPGLQFYGGNFLDGQDKGKNNLPYEFRTAFCLETQHFPDSPNHDNFPSTILEPEQNYYSICIYRFKTDAFEN